MTDSDWIPADTWAARILLARTQRGLNQEQAADKCGLSRATWSTWERGVVPRNQVDVTKAIAAALQVDLTWLALGGALSAPR
jgi:transcriptional regulator with XRE-family HTH domain